MDPSLSPDDPNYWLDYWNGVHSHLFNQLDLDVHLVNHNALCADAPGMLNKIFITLGVEANAAFLSRQISPQFSELREFGGLRSDLLRRATDIYSALLDSPENIRPMSLEAVI
jgi:hypothetical protein